MSDPCGCTSFSRCQSCEQCVECNDLLYCNACHTCDNCLVSTSRSCSRCEKHMDNCCTGMSHCSKCDVCVDCARKGHCLWCVTCQASKADCRVCFECFDCSFKQFQDGGDVGCPNCSACDEEACHKIRCRLCDNGLCVECRKVPHCPFCKGCIDCLRRRNMIIEFPKGTDVFYCREDFMKYLEPKYVVCSLAHNVAEQNFGTLPKVLVDKIFTYV